MYKFIGKNGKFYELDIKQNANCPASEKNGTGPGSCGGSTDKDLQQDRLLELGITKSKLDKLPEREPDDGNSTGYKITKNINKQLDSFKSELDKLDNGIDSMDNDKIKQYHESFKSIMNNNKTPVDVKSTVSKYLKLVESSMKRRK